MRVSNVLLRAGCIMISAWIFLHSLLLVTIIQAFHPRVSAADTFKPKTYPDFGEKLQRVEQEWEAVEKITEKLGHAVLAIHETPQSELDENELLAVQARILLTTAITLDLFERYVLSIL